MEIFKYLSNNIKKEILNSDISTFSELEEIRIRNNKPIILKFLEKEKIINYKIKTEDILETLEKVTENSIYTYEKQIANGFIKSPFFYKMTEPPVMIHAAMEATVKVPV